MSKRLSVRRPGLFPVKREEFPEVVDVWEASVRATHDFLRPGDIEIFRPLILNQYLGLMTLISVRDFENRVLAFMGLTGPQMQALFVHPDWMGRGIGRELGEHAIAECGVREVDVNEQNVGAVAFYSRMGFVVIGRDETDALGKPYPILHMVLG